MTQPTLPPAGSKNVAQRTVLPPDLAPLAPNFTREDMSCPHCNVLGTTSAAIIAVQKMRDILAQPLHINSSYRCAVHNKKIGGVKKSQHVLGIAFDIRCFPHQRAAFIAAAHAAGFTYIKIYSAWLHVDIRKASTLLQYEGEK